MQSVVPDNPPTDLISLRIPSEIAREAENIFNGIFARLDGFLCRNDLENVFRLAVSLLFIGLGLSNVATRLIT